MITEYKLSFYYIESYNVPKLNLLITYHRTKQSILLKNIKTKKKKNIKNRSDNPQKS